MKFPWLAQHTHEWTSWEVKVRMERLFGPLGITEGPAYFNVRECTICHYTQMERINEKRES